MLIEKIELNLIQNWGERSENGRKEESAVGDGNGEKSGKYLERDE